MSIGPEIPTLDQLKSIAKDCGIDLSNELATDYLDMLATTLKSYRRIDELVERKLPVKYPRTPGYRPTAAENPLNAWYWRCEIPGASDGLLAGERIAVKDTVCVAGVPMMNGSKILEGYIPEVDATIVTRMLDAGATIVGKASCEDFSCSAGGMTCSSGPVGNPWKPDHNPGASSNGSAVLISQGQVDLAIGGDQGGSIRLPAAMSGCYGLKPTFGLVPYTGCAMIESTLDHVGPMASSTRGIAKLLTAIAGYDADDPRQQGRIAPGFDVDYMPALQRGVDGLRIAVVKEGFGQKSDEHGLIASEPEVDECVLAAIDKLRSLGARVDEVSIPEHLDGYPIWNAICVEGTTAFMLNGNGLGTNWQGWYNTTMGEHIARGLRSRPHDLPPTVLSMLLSGEYMRKYYFNRYYAKAQNTRHIVTNAYNAMLSKYDVIACPTTPHRATLMAQRDDLPSTIVGNALDQLRNTVVADVTGHPAISIPCGVRDGLPIGMMLTGRHFDERTLIAVSAAFESLGDWKSF